MSYSLEAYMLDLDRLRSAVGGRDAPLVTALRDTDPERFDDASDGISLGNAVSDLIMGDQMVGPPHQYGYALLEICRHLGTPLACDMWCGVQYAAVDDSGVGAAVMQSGPPVNLPPNEDVPQIGFLDRGKVKAMVADLGDAGLTNDDMDLQELLAEYEGSLRAAAAADKDLVLFCY